MRAISRNLLPRIKLGFVLIAVAILALHGWKVYESYVIERADYQVFYGISAAVLISLVGTLYAVIRYRLILPIEVLTERISALASGEVDFAIPRSRFNDEMGRMFEALEILRGNALQIKKMSTWLRVAEKEANIGYWRLTLADNNLFWSDGVYRIHGLSRQDYTPDLENVTQFYHPEDRQRVEEAVVQIRQKHEAYHLQTRIQQPSGDIRYVESRAQVERDNRGNIVAIIGVFQDLTELKRQQVALEQHQLYLEELVDARTSELVKAKNQAEQANMLKTDFIMNVSHELRTPMHAIISLSRIGKEKFDRWDREHHIQNFETIQQSSERLMLMINDLLDMSKLESGKMEYHFGEYDLTAICRSAIQQVQTLLTDKSLHCQLENEHERVLAYCDKPKVEHILSNLLSNAIKFTPEHKHIYIRLHDRGEQIVCEVTDQGIGIPEDELNQVFEKFFQSSKTRSGAGGTGLGLAICKEMIEAMYGHIGCGPNPQGGSIFYFSLRRHSFDAIHGEAVA